MSSEKPLHYYYYCSLHLTDPDVPIWKSRMAWHTPLTPHSSALQSARDSLSLRIRAHDLILFRDNLVHLGAKTRRRTIRSQQSLSGATNNLRVSTLLTRTLTLYLYED